MKRIFELPGIPRRERNTHKGTYGRVLIVAGSPGMAGAAVLAARGALRAGSGLVTVALPASISTLVGAACPEATQVLLPELDDPDFHGKMLKVLGGRLESGTDALAVGPGLGTSGGSCALVEEILENYSGPHVLDADALNLIAAFPAIQQITRPLRVWTPHPGEFQRLTGEKPRDMAERVAACARFVERFGGVVVLKGHGTVVLEKDRYYINTTGNPGMATGGSGDVLTGVLASLLGQGLAPFEAACLAVRLHGSAGDFAADSLGEASVTAGDIVESLPRAIRREAIV